MSRSHKLALAASGIMLILIAFLWLAGDYLLAKPGPLKLEQAPDMGSLISTREQAIESANHVVNYLSSIVIGLFILLGFSLPKRDPKFEFDAWDYTAIAMFLAFAFVSLYLSYLSRMQVAQFLPRPLLDLDSFISVQNVILSNVSWQAIFTALAAVPAAFICGRYLFPP